MVTEKQKCVNNLLRDTT